MTGTSNSEMNVLRLSGSSSPWATCSAEMIVPWMTSRSMPARTRSGVSTRAFCGLTRTAVVTPASRIRATAAQSELDAAARRRNLRGAFQVAGGVSLPAHVALVDDVMTTGATLHAAATALRRAGVTRVDAWVCARVP